MSTFYANKLYRSLFNFPHTYVMLNIMLNMVAFSLFENHIQKNPEKV